MRISVSKGKQQVPNKDEREGSLKIQKIFYTCIHVVNYSQYFGRSDVVSDTKRHDLKLRIVR